MKNTKNKKGIKLSFILLFVFGLLIIGVNAAEELNSCGEISSPGEYVLTQDVSSSESCFFVSSNDVFLDCNNYKITFATDVSSEVGGVVAFGVNNVEVKNCVIEDGNVDSFGTVGVAFLGVDGGNVENNQITLNSDQPMGIIFSDTLNVLASNNLIHVTSTTPYSTGISVGGEGTTYNGLFDNVVSVSGEEANGIWLNEGANQLFVDGNNINVEGTGSKALTLEDVLENEVANNEFNAIGYGSNSMSLSASNNNYFHDNVADTLGGTALVLYGGSEDNFFLNNDMTSDSEYVVQQYLDSQNTLQYENSNGVVMWERNDLTTGMDLTQGGTVTLNYNNVDLEENVGAIELDDNIKITIKGLDYQITPKVLRNGVRCDDNPSICGNLYYANGELSFDAFALGSYTTEA